MWFLPYEQLKIRTYLNPDEVRQKLNGAVSPNRPWFPFGSSDKPFYGEINENYFRVRRIISYRNDFLPLIEGEIHPDGNGSVINLTIQIKKRTMAFFGLFFLGLIFFIFDLGRILTNFLTNPGLAKLISILDGFFWISLMLIVAYMMIFLSYQFEAIKAKNFFRSLFDETGYY